MKSAVPDTNTQVTYPALQFDRKNNRAQLLGNLTGLALFFAMALASVALKPVSIALALFFRAACLGVWIFGPALRARLSRSDAVVLWLRRFRADDYEQGAPFSRILRKACVAMAVPVTIQDRSFRTSKLAGLLIAWPLFLLTGYIWIAGLFLAILLLPIWQSKWALIVGWGGWTIVLLVVAYVLIRRKGVAWIRDDRVNQQTHSLLDRARQGTFGSTAVLVFKCSDTVWREVVEEAIRVSDVVLVDITEVTENIAWELAAAVRHGKSEQILLMYEYAGDDDAAAMNVACQRAKELNLDVPASWIDQSVFVYPTAASAENQTRYALRNAIAARLLGRDKTLASASDLASDHALKA